MVDRFKRLWTGSKKLYQVGSPVIIVATALLYDAQNNSVLAQVKYKDISSKRIKAIKVKIVEHDTVGRIIGEPFEYQYLDLETYRNKEFGQKLPVPLKNTETRSFDVFVTEVAFGDNSIWKSTSEVWEQLPSQKSLSSFLRDAELEKQYLLKYGKDSKYKPLAVKDLWLCTCGAVNHDDEVCCYRCDVSKKTIFEVDIDELKKDRNERLTNEAVIREKQRIEEEKRQVEDTARKKKIVKLSAIAGIAIVVIWIVVSIISNVIIPSSKYNKAMSLSEKGDYEGAVAIFQELGDYKDCEQQIPYQQALKHLSEKDYKSAISEFDALEGFRDSKIKKKESTYQLALVYFAEKEYSKARDMFEELGDYKDAKEYISHFYYLPAVIEQGPNYRSYTIGYDDSGNIGVIVYYLGNNYDNKYDNIKYDKKGRIIEFFSNKTGMKYKIKNLS